MTFDHITAFFVVGLLYVFTPLATWGVLTGRRETTTSWWCLGGVMMGLAALWASLFSRQLPWSIYQVVSNLLVFGGAFFKIKVLRLWLGKATPARAAGFFFLAYFVFAFVIEQYFGRHILHLVMVASHVVLYGYLAFLAWCVFKVRKELSALWIFAGYGAVMTVLGFVLFNAGVGTPFIWATGIPAMILSIVGALTSFSNHLGYVGMLLERSQANEQEAIAESARQSERRALTDTIAIAQRERLLGNLARKLVHELSQPLTSIVSTVRLMRRAESHGRLNELDLHNVLNRLDIASAVATGVVNQMRPVAKLQTNDREPVSLSQVARQALDILDVKMEGCSLSFDAVQREDDLVRANSGELIQLVINLLMNSKEACRSAGISPQIHIAVDADLEWVKFCITDNGPGFTKDALGCVGKVPYTSKDDGMGVGLWLSSEIVQRYGGNLHFLNHIKGACVELQMPRWRQELV